MPDSAANTEQQSNPHGHPAVKAWSSIDSRYGPPQQVLALCGRKNKKSAVFRISWSGKKHFSLIAKRCVPQTAVSEHLIYEQYISQLPIKCLRLLGILHDPDGESSWLFIEDAGSEYYAPEDPVHQQAAGRWLAALHGHGMGLDGSKLSQRGAEHYLSQLRTALKTIDANLLNVKLQQADKEELKAILSGFERLERNWENLAAYSGQLPQTLVHGDFVEKNICVGNTREDCLLLPFDWEMSGWGVPAADLNPQMRVDLGFYVSVMKDFQPQLDAAEVLRWQCLGDLFRNIAAINWAAWSLAYPWIQGTMANMVIYRHRLDQWFTYQKWIA